SNTIRTAPALAPTGLSRKNSWSVTADRAAIVDRADFLHRHQAARDHFVGHREEVLDFFVAVDDFDDHGQIHGKPKNFRSMHPARFTETDRATKSSGAGQVHF